ncbi:MAG: ribose 1,5-bisphosphate isomerase [Methanosarcinales archaeon]|nr:ribose 1,5-bisphosphate isomerase [Methanosarcinales archaeon]
MDIVLDIAKKIQTMEIRGAGTIARAAAGALKDYSQLLDEKSVKKFNTKISNAANVLVATRPTAVSLPNAIRMVMGYTGDTVNEARTDLIRRADQFIESSKEATERIGTIGSRRILNGDTIMTHCNSQAAISVIAQAHKAGKDINVFATESRPRRQGLLTIAQLNELGINTTLIVDSAVRYYMKDVDIVVVGADAVTANGSVINKIGTSQLAMAAHESRTNVIVAAETYKFSPRTLMGEMVKIEERDVSEVMDTDKLSAMLYVSVKNPAFDVTPSDYIDVICTEVGAISPEMSYIIIRDILGWDLQDMLDDELKTSCS